MKKILFISILSLFLCLNANAGADGENSLEKRDPKKVNDCFEGLNRGIFAFNQGLDNIIFEPVAKGFSHLPSPIKKGTGNVISNITNLITIPNNILQGDFKKAGSNTGRLLLNTTFGILGIFDVASGLGFSEYEKEDYGQTLATWGVGSGCYIVLPILGPSTVRDATGTLVNMLGGDAWYNITVDKDTQYFKESNYYQTKITGAVEFRAKNIKTIDNLEENSMDFYASVKSLYLQDRNRKILNSKNIIDGQNDSDWEEIETK